MVDVPIYLVGNKCDAIDRRVETKEGSSLALAWKTGFIETSARNNQNVHELFQRLLEMEKRRNITLNLTSKNNICKRKGKDKVKDCIIQ